MKKCEFCGKKINVFSQKLLPDEQGWVYMTVDMQEKYNRKACKQCFKTEITRLKQKKEFEKQQSKLFEATLKIDNIIGINEHNHTFTRLNYSNQQPKGAVLGLGISAKRPDKIHDLRLIRNYELLDNGSVLTSGGFGTATIGALTFGGFGAVTGAVLGKKTKMTSQLQIKLFMDDIENPVVYINISNKPIPKASQTYKKDLETAHKIISTFDILFSKNMHQQSNNQFHSENKNNVVETLREYNALLTEGIISQEEFELKKKQILQL